MIAFALNRLAFMDEKDELIKLVKVLKEKNIFEQFEIPQNIGK